MTRTAIPNADRRVEWFDQTLKGLDNGLLERPSVEYFVMGGGQGAVNADGRLNHGGRWAASVSWPPEGVEQVAFFLHADMSLSTIPPQVAVGQPGSSTSYTFDPRDPVHTAANTIHHDKDHPSHVILPVVAPTT